MVLDDSDRVTGNVSGLKRIFKSDAVVGDRRVTEEIAGLNRDTEGDFDFLSGLVGAVKGFTGGSEVFQPREKRRMNLVEEATTVVVVAAFLKNLGSS